MPANKDGDGGWKGFIWNSEKREFLGRTGGSWLKIFIFYVVFYGCLAGIFIGTIQAMLLTLSNYKPTYQDRVAPPGLSHSPRAEKAEITFNPAKEDTYKAYVDNIDKLLKAYSSEKQENTMEFEDCGDKPATYKDRGDLESGEGVRKVCRFYRSWLDKCSGLADNTYGFSEGKPCLIVKLNRIVNFRPRPPNATTTSQGQGNLIPISCKSKKEDDADKLGPVEYYGLGAGFPLQYYPYYGKLLQPHYLQPLVAIKFMNISLPEMRIECTVYGDNIYYSEKDRAQGRFDIKIQIAKS